MRLDSLKRGSGVRLAAMLWIQQQVLTVPAMANAHDASTACQQALPVHVTACITLSRSRHSTCLEQHNGGGIAHAALAGIVVVHRRFKQLHQAYQP